MARDVDVDLRELNALCDRAGGLDNLRTTLSKVLEEKKQDTRNCFFYESDPSGLPWKPLSESSLAQKKGTNIGRETNKLFDAIDIFVSGNEGQVFNDVPYAVFFNAVRPFLEWTLEDEQTLPKTFDQDIQRRLGV